MNTRIMRGGYHLLACMAAASIAACAPSPSSDDADAGRVYPYVTDMPAQKILDTDYKGIMHDLSALERYHFDIMVPKDWQVLDTALDVEPAAGDFDEVGVFRQPGDWMEDEFAPPSGEISVSVIKPLDPDQSAKAWLDELLENNIPTAVRVEERTEGTGLAEASDRLFHYNNGGVEYVMRAMAFRRGDHIIFLNCSDTANGYRDNAQACFVALRTFTLKADKEANPFSA